MSMTLRAWLVVLVCAVVIRLLTLAAYLLSDIIKARYAEIVRVKAIANNWITSHIQRGVTFWLPVVYFKLFGFNEFAARLPVLYRHVDAYGVHAYDG